MNMTESQKKNLQALVEAGAEVASVAFNPNEVVGDPEADALSAGWVQFQREDSTNLVEIVFTR